MKMQHNAGEELVDFLKLELENPAQAGREMLSALNFYFLLFKGKVGFVEVLASSFY